MPGESKLILGSVTASRIVYALCWFNLAAAFPAMSASLNYSIQDLGLLTASFLLGTGLFQIPAGLFSTQRGSAKVALIGLAIIAVTSAVSAVVADFQVQLLVRFLTGLGSAFYFSPALVIASSTLGDHRSGLALGLYNGSFQVGGGIAVFAFTPIAATFGWQLPFIMTSLLTFVVLGENLYALRKWDEPQRTTLSGTRKTLLSKDVWIAIVATLGLSSAFYVLTQFEVSYAEGVLRYTPFIAGVFSALTLIGALIGAPFWGFVADKLRNRRLIILLTALGGGLSIGLFALGNSVDTWIAAFVTGFFVLGSLTNLYAYPIQLPWIGRRLAPISLGLINGISIFGGAVATSEFPGIVLLYGYQYTWIILSIASLLLAPLIFLAREPYKAHAKSATETQV